MRWPQEQRGVGRGLASRGLCKAVLAVLLESLLMFFSSLGRERTGAKLGTVTGSVEEVRKGEREVPASGGWLSAEQCSLRAPTHTHIPRTLSRATAPLESALPLSGPQEVRMTARLVWKDSGLRESLGCWSQKSNSSSSPVPSPSGEPHTLR